jgi:ATP-dependent helicase/nuclease subunit A
MVDSDQLSQAVDRLLARIGQEGENVLTDVVETYYRESAESGKSWGSLPHKIREAAFDLLNEKSYLAMQNVADLEVEDWVGISRQIKAFIREHENAIAVRAQQAMALIGQKHLTASDFYRGSQGIYSFFEKKSQGVDLWKKANSYAEATIEENKWVGGKATKFIEATDPALPRNCGNIGTAPGQGQSAGTDRQASLQSIAAGRNPERV